MIRKNDTLTLHHCHHCGEDEPDMLLDSSFITNNPGQDAPKLWSIHHCASCSGAVMAGYIAGSDVISEIHPSTLKLSLAKSRNERLVAAMKSQQKKIQQASRDDAFVVQQAVH